MVHEIALTIKPTMSCNMRCRHCFNRNSLNEKHMIDINEVYRFLELATMQFRDVKVTFHGGEPSLAGYSFYKDVFQYQHILSEKYGTEFSNLFTTNGILLDEQLADLLIENDTLINISFAGPYNDILRSNTEAVYNTIRMIREKTRKMRIFCTICNPSYQYLDDIYEWFKRESLDFKILPVEPRGYASGEQSMLLEPQSFVKKLSEVYQKWLSDKECDVRCYTFEEFSCLRRNVQFKPFWFNREIALNPDEKIYPFGRPNDVQYCLGVPSEIDSLKKCFQSEAYQRLQMVLNQHWKKFCGNCESSHICRGVVLCMSYIYNEDNDSLKYSCNLSNQIFKQILSVNDKVIQDFADGKGELYNAYVRRQFQK